MNSKANYIIINVSSIAECENIDRLAERVKHILTQANGWSLAGGPAEVEGWLNRDGNKMRIIMAVARKIEQARNEQSNQK